MPNIRLRPVGLAAAATGLAMSATLVTAGSASAEASFDFTRVAGDNRYETAAKAAAEFGQAETVILASGEEGSYPDALTANYLAGLKDAPVLLTRQDKTPELVKEAISKAGAKNVVIIGGTGVVSEEQEESLRGTYKVSRLAGDNRFETAAAVIAEGNEAEGDTALLATGRNFPDALGGGPVAFAENMPLAITKQDDAPDEVVRALREAGISKVVILGGESVVGQDVVDELKAKGITVTERFDGDDRSETSSLLAEYAVANWGFDASAINIASGYVDGDGADALGGAALTGQQERPLLITKSQKTAGEGIDAYLADADLTEGMIFGGPGAVTEQLEDDMIKTVLGSGAQNEDTREFYDTPQAAVQAAEEGQTITVFGQENDGGFAVTTKGLTIQGEDDATLNGPIAVNGADDVTITGLNITPDRISGSLAGIYLNDVDGLEISDNEIVGSGTGAGIINVTGGEAEVVEIKDNLLKDLTQGTFANPSAEYTITGNEFRNNTAGSANDAVSVIEDNEFVNNGEGVGVSVEGSTIEGNYFANNEEPGHVGDYTTEKVYDLEEIIELNEFDEPVVVNEADQHIVDES